VRFPDTCIHACIHARYTCTRAERRDGETGLKSPRKSPSLRSLPYVLPAGGSRGGGREREKSLPTAAGSSMTMTRADSLSKHAVVNVCSRFMPDVATSPLRGFASLFRRRLLFGYRVNTGRQSSPPPTTPPQSSAPLRSGAKERRALVCLQICVRSSRLEVLWYILAAGYGRPDPSATVSLSARQFRFLFQFLNLGQWNQAGAGRL